MPVTLAAAALLARGPSHESVMRPCILIAEDYGVIAMMLYEDLSEAGSRYLARSHLAVRLSPRLSDKPQMQPFWT